MKLHYELEASSEPCIGDMFLYGDQVYMCVIGPSHLYPFCCTDCVFRGPIKSNSVREGKIEHCHTGEAASCACMDIGLPLKCLGSERSDKTDVIFIKALYGL